MSYIQGSFELISVKQLNSTCYDFSIFCPEIVALAKAGQFLHIRCEGKTLRRPISICEIDRVRNTIRFVFDIRGEGTLWLSQRIRGERLDILGPLGNGFNVFDSEKNALFVGGGIGVPPLLETAKLFNGQADAILGFKCSEISILIEDFQKECANVFLTSDDGSLCEKGFATNLLIECIKNKRYDIIYSCGPMSMLKEVSIIAKTNGIPCFISLEERMGCGVGACLVCACRIKADEAEIYKHVCKDGPVFNAEEVIW
jgi:dihydroorotate dehydrogenase electron transfer subunit